jgi:hypothetical protein
MAMLALGPGAENSNKTYEYIEKIMRGNRNSQAQDYAGRKSTV